MATMMIGADVADKYVRENPETSLSRNAIKCLLRSGCIPSVHAGTRRFYSYEAFLRFLEDGNDTQQLDGYGNIRRIV